MEKTVGKKMQNIIQKKITEIEQNEDVRILHCVESGSRAWGFASPNSDYDVRFIYVRPKEFYLRLDNTRDVIEYQLDEELDINGWDLQKALKLLYTSNPTLFEWNNSNIVYKTTPEWKKISGVIGHYFQSKKGLCHYLSMAKRNYHEYLKSETVKLKKYFYVLRPILACKWILDKNTPPPMEFSILMSEYLDDSIRGEVEKLLELKMGASELKEKRRIDAINQYIDSSIAELDQKVSALPSQKVSNWEELNGIFLSMLD